MRAPKIASQDHRVFAAGGRWLASRCCNARSSQTVVVRVHQLGSRLRDADVMFATPIAMAGAPAGTPIAAASRKKRVLVTADVGRDQHER
jgi:hypothetical protein